MKFVWLSIKCSKIISLPKNSTVQSSLQSEKVPFCMNFTFEGTEMLVIELQLKAFSSINESFESGWNSITFNFLHS